MIPCWTVAGLGGSETAISQSGWLSNHSKAGRQLRDYESRVDGSTVKVASAKVAA
jgi:hypothetical protein